MYVQPQWVNMHLLPPLIDNKRGEPKMTPPLIDNKRGEPNMTR
jgi:hypothetical protein